MGWTYSGDPSSSNKDAVRFEIGDTVQSDPLLQDEEIDYTIGHESNLVLAAAKCCEAISAKFAREADKQIGTLRVWASQKSDSYRKRASELRRRGMGYNAPYVGSLAVGDAEADDSDTSLSQPAFKRGFMNNNDA